MSGPITLPATLEDFVTYQERLIRRKLTVDELEATAKWLEIFNDIGTGGMDGAKAIEDVDYLISQATDDEILRFLRAAREWIVYAWKETAT